MVNWYIKKIENGSMTVEEVPELWRSDVEDKLALNNK